MQYVDFKYGWPCDSVTESQSVNQVHYLVLEKTIEENCSVFYYKLAAYNHATSPCKLNKLKLGMFEMYQKCTQTSVDMEGIGR